MLPFKIGPVNGAEGARKRSSAEGVGCANTVIRWWLSDEPVPAEPTSRKAGQVAAGKRLFCQAMWARPWTSAGGFAVSASANTKRSFEDKIDADLLPRLTDDGLKDMGVLLAIGYGC